MKKSLVVSKSNDIARTGNTFTVMETKILEYCLANLYKDDVVTPATLFKVDVDALSVHFGLTRSNAYREIKEAAKNIQTKIITFPMDDTGRIICSTSWIVSVIHNDIAGELTLRFSPDLIQHISGESIKRNFTCYLLKEVAGFKNVYSNVLYNFCKSYAYKNTNFEVFLTLEEFRRLLCLRDGQYKLWGSLNRTVLGTIKEINEKTSLTITMYVKKTRKQVTGLLFKMGIKEKA